MTTYYEMNEDFLMHFGVPGMKWGQRKRQPTSSGSGMSKKEYKSLKKQSKKQYKNDKLKASRKHFREDEKHTKKYENKNLEDKKVWKQFHEEWRNIDKNYKKDIADAKSAYKARNKEIKSNRKVTDSQRKDAINTGTKYMDLDLKEVGMITRRSGRRYADDMIKKYGKKQYKRINKDPKVKQAGYDYMKKNFG